MSATQPFNPWISGASYGVGKCSLLAALATGRVLGIACIDEEDHVTERLVAPRGARKPESSRHWSNSIATVSTLRFANESTSRCKTFVKLPKLRTGSAVRSAPTVATCILAPTSIAAAFACTIGSACRILLSPVHSVSSLTLLLWGGRAGLRCLSISYAGSPGGVAIFKPATAHGPCFFGVDGRYCFVPRDFYFDGSKMGRFRSCRYAKSDPSRKKSSIMLVLKAKSCIEVDDPFGYRPASIRP